MVKAIKSGAVALGVIALSLNLLTIWVGFEICNGEREASIEKKERKNKFIYALVQITRPGAEFGCWLGRPIDEARDD